MARIPSSSIRRTSVALAATAALLVAIASGATPAHAGKPGTTPSPSPVTGPMHIGDLDAALSVGRGSWTMKVTITAHDANEKPVSGATVAGRWSGATEGTVACVTGSRGTCTVTSSRASLGAKSMTFTAAAPTFGTIAYDASANHDPDGSSDGTSITVTR